MGLQPVAVRRVSATRHYEHDIVGLDGDRPGIEIDAVAHQRIRVDFDIGGRAVTAHLLHRNLRVLPQEFAYRLLSPADFGHAAGDYGTDHHDAGCALFPS